MKRIFTLLVVGLLFCVSTTFAQSIESTCKEQVRLIIAAIESKEKMTGSTANLNGLSKNDIEEMLKVKSYCETMQEIYKRIIK